MYNLASCLAFESTVAVNVPLPIYTKYIHDNVECHPMPREIFLLYQQKRKPGTNFHIRRLLNRKQNLPLIL